MTPTATDQEHVDAILTCLNAALATIGSEYHAYETDELKRMDQAGLKPDDYVEITLARRFGDAPRRSARTGSGGWRITTRFVSREWISNARNMRTFVRVALEFIRLSVGDVLTTPVLFEGEDDIAEDDGWYSGLTTWTYARTANPSH